MRKHTKICDECDPNTKMVGRVSSYAELEYETDTHCRVFHISRNEKVMKFSDFI